jgi:formate hydrogenlyase subunit 6/NADH:ubiquinone oxidoreductase subunit I
MEDLELIFKDMLDKSVEFARTDENYKADMEKLGIFKINWDVCGIKGYQVFEIENCFYKIGEHINDPDVSFKIEDKERVIPFLKGESVNYFMRYKGKGVYVLGYITGWKEFDHPEKGRMREPNARTFITAQFYKTRGKFTPLMLNKLPMFKKFIIGMDIYSEEKQYGSYIPVNQTLGTFENQILPGKIFKHFIDKASHIVVKDCGCREAFNHVGKPDDITLGCMYLGDDVLQIIDPPLNGVRVVTKEEAMDHVQRGIDNGLIPILARVIGEIEGFGKEDTGHILSCCFCCTCCCINGKKLSSTSEATSSIYKRMKGLLTEVDQEKCVGCEMCMEVCVFNGMEMVELENGDSKAHIRDKKCLGCGRCANICPEDAISIEIDDDSRLDEFIKKIESYVDVEEQSTAKEMS